MHEVHSLGVTHVPEVGADDEENFCERFPRLDSVKSSQAFPKRPQDIFENGVKRIFVPLESAETDASIDAILILLLGLAASASLFLQLGTSTISVRFESGRRENGSSLLFALRFCISGREAARHTQQPTLRTVPAAQCGSRKRTNAFPLSRSFRVPMWYTPNDDVAPPCSASLKLLCRPSPFPSIVLASILLYLF